MSSEEPTDTYVLSQLAGHYLANAAATLLRDGLPMVSIDVSGPDEVDEGTEATGHLDFHDTHAQRFGRQDAIAVWLGWNSVSGWRLVVETQQLPDIERWMGAGLTPSPEQISSFVLSASLDATSAGSEERPFYRNFGENLGALLERLIQHRRRNVDFPNRFRRDRDTAALGHARKSLLADERVVQVPMRAGELEALRQAVAYLETGYQLPVLLEKLAADLTARVAHTGEAAASDLVQHFDEARDYLLRGKPQK